METWEQILVDTESLIQHEKRVELLEETAELRRAEEATSSLATRLMGGRDTEVSIAVRNGQTIRLVIHDCSTQWLSGVVDSKEIIVPLPAIAHVKGLSAGSVGDFSGPVSRNMSFAHAIRVFADKHREAVICMGSESVTGKIVRVGSDCLDIVCAGEILLLAFAAIDYIAEKRY